MLRFAVFDDAGPHPAFPLRHAHIVGKDDIVTPGSVDVGPGLITCRKARDEAAALALQFDAGAAGLLTLQTCLLPDRDEPYLLELELARHRIMMVLVNLEEWGQADLAPDHPVLTQLDEAREKFTAALVAHPPRTSGYTPEQARLARQSLISAIEAGERLALLAAEEQLTSRLRRLGDASAEDDGEPGAPAASPSSRTPRIGCTVHSDQFAEPLQRILASNVDFICAPMRWRELEREEGVYDFTPTDRWIEWAVRAGKKPVVSGPVLDFSANVAPGWLHVWEHDYDTLREFAFEHLKRVVTRYRRTVQRWTVISAVNVNEGFSFSLDQMIDLTRLSALAVRKLHPGARVLVEVSEPWGESGTDNPRTLSPLLYARLVVEAGIGVDAIALRLQCGDDRPGRSTRDLMQLSTLLDNYTRLERPLHITAFGAPAEQVTPQTPDIHPGYWRTPWSPEQQAAWLTQAAAVILSKPAVRSLCWQALFDSPRNPEMVAGGLISADGRARPALKSFTDLIGALRLGRAPNLATQEHAGALAGAR